MNTKFLFNLYKRIKTISSFSDFFNRLKNLFILIYKISIGHYGEKYWEQERKRKIEFYERNLKEINDINLHFEMIICFYENKNYQKCEDIYSFVLTKTSFEEIPIKIHLTIADVLFRLWKYDLSYKEYSYVSNKDKNSKQAVLGIVWILEKERNFNKMIEFIKPILDKEYDSVLLIKLVNVYINLKDFEKAIFYSKKILEHKDKSFYKEALILSLYSNIELKKFSEADLILTNLLKYYNSIDDIIKIIDNMKGSFHYYAVIDNCLKNKNLSVTEKIEYQNIILKLFEAEVKNSTNNVEEVSSILKSVSNRIKNIRIKKQMLSNILDNELEISKKQTKLCSKPRHLTVVLTNKCNLKCIMCDMPIKNNIEISPKIVSAIKEMMPFLKTIVWLGGETFLYKDFMNLLRASYKYNIDQEIITNGLLLNEDIIEELLKNNINLTLSIDGITKEVYESVRINGSFEKLIDNLETIKILKKKFNSNSIIRLNALILKNNYNQIVDFLEFAYKYNFDTLAYNCLNEGSGNEQMDIFSNYYSNDIKNEIYNNIKKVKGKALYYGICIENTLPTEEYLDIINKNTFVKNFSFKESNSSLVCHIPYKKIFISPNGDVYPSCFCKNKIGNLNYNSLEEVWNSKQMQEYRKRIIENNIKGFCGNSCVYERLDKNSLLY